MNRQFTLFLDRIALSSGLNSSSILPIILAGCAFFTLCRDTQAQFNNGNNSNNGNSAAGVIVNAQGVVSLRDERPLSPANLKKLVDRYAADNLSRELTEPTSERVVSLNALSAAIRTHLDQQKPLPVEVMYLAGLQRLDTIVFDTERKDIYLAGPADAFGPDATGRMLGRTSGRPVMRLDDLITALRCEGLAEGSIGCSIDPQEENLARLQEYLRTSSGPSRSAQVQQRFHTMATILGPQEISVWGVPPDSHFAAGLVEADLRMKAIALGINSAGVPGIRSHLSLLRPQGNSLQRWWFVPMYDPLETNQEQTLFRLSGQRAKVLAQEEFSNVKGQRNSAPITRQSTEKFAMLFTEHFQELADKSPTFGELQNLYDAAVCATLLVQNAPRLGMADLLETLRKDERLQLSTYPVPRIMPSVSTFRMGGPGTVLGLVGGVTMDLNPVVRSTKPGNTPDVNHFRGRAEQSNYFGEKNLK